jgi:hypothetical protein
VEYSSITQQPCAYLAALMLHLEDTAAPLLLLQLGVQRAAVVVADCYRNDIKSIAVTRRATSADRRKTSRSGLLKLDSKVPVFQVATTYVGLQCRNRHLGSSCRTPPMLEQESRSTQITDCHVTTIRTANISKGFTAEK